MHSQPTVIDVAAAAGVSRQTVSNVLNSPEIVRPETRERVERAIQELGYLPHASARRLRTRRSSTIGIRLDHLAADGISGSVLDRFLHALTEQAATRGLRVMLFTAADADDEIAQLRRLSDGADVDAFVLTSTVHDDPRIDWLWGRGIRFVAFGRPWGHLDAPHPWVDVDGQAGVRAATAHFVATAGPRVGYIGWPAGSGTGDDRRAGWASVIAEHAPAGMSADGLLADLEIDALEGVAEGGRAARELVARTDVDAIVCASDSLALGAFLAVGDTVPVCGFDDTPVAVSLGFSSVEQQLGEVARAVLDLLALPDDATDAQAHRLVTPRLVVR
ncbi:MULTISPECIES: LacI family DNA-binding transcriptional regulator [Microbacterium]|jgi:DNA-binding LacI/PurR family transcriptional regulator|uniref:LacI family DNA-binding transcriptional regulator n=1 Tax=Microbacterium TaxID=33882 RepID=UPI0010F8FFC6|nr:LacI family DNA-binding transcriptional regulator [Microbacterium sp. 4NA327F11]MCK9920063.1 LacI family DNA-binding transcriptional regulator [Microbacteriaceae bacterium K1510]